MHCCDVIFYVRLTNEWFARDTSKKVRAIKRAQGMAGKHTAVHPLYGYKKDPDDPEKWVIDDEAAEIVRRIFRMTINGKGPYEIATILERERILCPSAYLAERGAGNRRNSDFADPCRWWGTTVSYILNRMDTWAIPSILRRKRPAFGISGGISPPRIAG